ncbi:hypothetical protein DPMN_160461 [Dreissena polymorpha]|uniref:Uncharacterized protein n=1 Tax=Dreissena polymorpha TaxID=45954 RepID=A0A9D4EKU2_DREPO|nr:hypothetical protein DPMN_160461 [Dreissena polymorpha]
MLRRRSLCRGISTELCRARENSFASRTTRANIPPTYLPANTTKLDLFEDYERNLAPDIRSLKLTAFKSVWSSCVPHMRIASPRDDICAKCEHVRNSVVDAVDDNWPLTRSVTI